MMSARDIIGHADAMATGQLFRRAAFELHVPNEQLYLLWTTLMAARASFGLKPFGLYAAESMRLEKGYRHWKADLMVEFNPLNQVLTVYQS